MNDDLPQSAKRVQQVLDDAGVPGRVVVLPQSTRTAVDAAASIGCSVAQIAKSLVFRRKDTGAAVLVIASGINRVDEKLVAEAIGAELTRADAGFVRESTGYAIGGVPPVAHARQIETIVDEDLLALATIWAAGGTPHAVFPLTPSDLLRITGGRAIRVALRKE